MICMRVMASNLLLLIATLLTTFASFATQERPGYLSEVKSEKDQRFYEVFIFATPAVKTPPISELIFNEKLSREFREKYREKFGQIDTSTIIYQPTKFSVLDENRGAVLKVETDNQERKQFGEFMVKRLIEWHVDNYFKTEPSMRPVYELKEKLSHVQVEVTKETRLNAQYSFSDNTLDLIVDGPLFQVSKITLLMDPKKFGPGPLIDEKLYLANALSKKSKIITTATAVDGISTLEFQTSTGAAAAFKNGGPSPRETRWIVGLGYSY
jgi:hypothetical protein